MPFLGSGITTVLTIPAGQFLVIKVITGTVTAAGAGLAKDCSATRGAGVVYYGPFVFDTPIRLTTAGTCEYQLVDGEPINAVAENITQRRTRVATRLWMSNPAASAASAITGYGFPGPTAITSWMLADTEAPFDAVSIILANTTGSTITVTAASAGTPTQVSSFNSNYSATGSFTFAGSATGTITAGTATNPTFLVSDALSISSAARVDGGSRALLALAASFTTATDGSTQLSYWNRNGTAWGTSLTSGDSNGRILSTLNEPGTIAIGSLFAGGANQSGNSCIFGFAYWARGVVKTIMCAGDSITAGNTLTNTTRQWLLKAVQATSTPANPMEYMIVGLGGQQAVTYAALARKIMTLSGVPAGVGVPTHLIYSAFTPNVGATIGTSQLNGMRQPLALTLAQAETLGVGTAVWTGLPRNSDATTAYWTTGNDAARVAYNDSLESFAPGSVLDFSTALGDSSAPQRMQTTNIGYPLTVSGDFLHPSDAADTRLAVGDSYLPGGVVAPWLASL